MALRDSLDRIARETASNILNIEVDPEGLACAIPKGWTEAIRSALDSAVEECVKGIEEVITEDLQPGLVRPVEEVMRAIIDSLRAAIRPAESGKEKP